MSRYVARKNVSLHPDQLAYIEALANAHGRSFSEQVRYMLHSTDPAMPMPPIKHGGQKKGKRA